MRTHRMTARVTGAVVFLGLAGVAAVPYLAGPVTPFYGFVVAPALLLAAVAGADWVSGCLMSGAAKAESTAACEAVMADRSKQRLSSTSGRRNESTGPGDRCRLATWRARSKLGAVRNLSACAASAAGRSAAPGDAS